MVGIFGKRTIFALVVVLFVVASIGGVFSLCGMSPLDHLSHWQSVSAATAQQQSDALLVLLMATVAFLYVVRDVLLLQQMGEHPARYRDKSKGRVFDPLGLAFARGILNTKAY